MSQKIVTQTALYSQPSSVGEYTDSQFRLEFHSPVKTVEFSSTLSPTYAFTDLKVYYPNIVKQALCSLYSEYNAVFRNLIVQNQEWKSDYQYILSSNLPLNPLVQIDMRGLDQITLNILSTMNYSSVEDFLRKRIFEIENSWALYHMLEVVHQTESYTSLYEVKTRAMLDSLKKHFGKKIALLAPTKEKYFAMKQTEFGFDIDGFADQVRVQALSGFDAFFGPDEFYQHLQQNNNQCEYLLFVRASDPISKLRDPRASIEHPLFSDDTLRRIVKENSITFNIDNPTWKNTDIRRINDTKLYMPPMNMGFMVTDIIDLETQAFRAYLVSQDPTLDFLSVNQVKLRAKPALGTFGCYGHLRGTLADSKFKSKLKKELSSRGNYIIQIEQSQPNAVNMYNQQEYAYIDRVFCGHINGKIEFFGGHREFLPFESQEVKSGRLHGNRDTISAEIL